MSKIPKIESKSQPTSASAATLRSDSDVKDTQNWKQITTDNQTPRSSVWVIAMSKIPKIESKSQRKSHHRAQPSSDSDVKDTQNWKQITTRPRRCRWRGKVIAMSKIPKIESKSQPGSMDAQVLKSDSDVKDTQNWKQITTHIQEQRRVYKVIAMSKIPKIESKSQQFAGLLVHLTQW